MNCRCHNSKGIKQLQILQWWCTEVHNKTIVYFTIIKEITLYWIINYSSWGEEKKALFQGLKLILFFLKSHFFYRNVVHNVLEASWSAELRRKSYQKTKCKIKMAFLGTFTNIKETTIPMKIIITNYFLVHFISFNLGTDRFLLEKL